MLVTFAYEHSITESIPKFALVVGIQSASYQTLSKHRVFSDCASVNTLQ